MAGFRCPFCNEYMSLSPSTKSVHRINFEHTGLGASVSLPYLEVSFMRCPNEECKQYTISARGVNNFVNNERFEIHPQAIYEHYPDYVPEAIRNDYEEACKIVSLSPKAAATLARRCLQGMIHDFWDIHGKNLNAEISMLQAKIPAAQWRALDALRKVGNIGAHMEHDVNVIIDIGEGEALKLLDLIEHLIETWYIDRHDSELLFAELESMGNEKTAARKATPQDR